MNRYIRFRYGGSDGRENRMLTLRPFMDTKGRKMYRLAYHKYEDGQWVEESGVKEFQQEFLIGQESEALERMASVVRSLKRAGYVESRRSHSLHRFNELTPEGCLSPDEAMAVVDKMLAEDDDL